MNNNDAMYLLLMTPAALAQRRHLGVWLGEFVCKGVRPRGTPPGPHGATANAAGLLGWLGGDTHRGRASPACPLVPTVPGQQQGPSAAGVPRGAAAPSRERLAALLVSAPLCRPPRPPGCGAGCQPAVGPPPQVSDPAPPTRPLFCTCLSNRFSPSSLSEPHPRVVSGSSTLSSPTLWSLVIKGATVGSDGGLGPPLCQILAGFLSSLGLRLTGGIGLQ